MERENRGVAFLGLTERFKFAVPRFSKRKAKFTGKQLRVSPSTYDGRANRILAQDTVADAVCLHMEYPERWTVHPPSTIAAGGLIFGDLEPHMLPPKKR